MLKKAIRAWQDWEQKLHHSWGKDLTTPAGRRAASLHAHLADYAFLRVFWTNMHEVAPGVWRSNQPGRGRFDRIEALGIRSLLNLRGQESFSTVLFEAEECDRRAIALTHLGLSSRALGPAGDYLRLLDLFETLQKPFLMHCKSGADRTGLAAAFYLLDQLGADPDTARAQLSWTYGHVRSSNTGILDHMLNAYLAAQAETGVTLRDWLTGSYDPEALTASFRR